MPAVARGDSQDTVQSAHGTGVGCPSPLTTSTNECSTDVFVNGIGIVRKDDKSTTHTALGCGSESPQLSTYSLDVFANGLNIADIGDNYKKAGDGGDNLITSGSPDVYANGS